MSGDNDRNVGTFFPPACPGYRHHFVEGKSPPPTVPLMQHDVALACTKR